MTENKTSKAWHISLWITQGLLAAVFGMAGFMKITAPMEKLVQSGMSFVAHYQAETVRLIGVTELLAAVGLILPSVLRKFTKLTPLSALGLSIVMIFATQYHVSHHEPTSPTIIMFVLTVFVAWGRFKKVPILPK